MSDPKPRRIRVGRWCLSLRRYRAARTFYTSGGRRTPGPWWALFIRGFGEIVLSHDRTLFGWDDL